MKIYLRLLGYVKPHWKLLAFALLCMGVVSALEGSKAIIVKPVFDEIFINKNRKMLELDLAYGSLEWEHACQHLI